MELRAIDPIIEADSGRGYTGLTDIVERHYLPRIMGNDKARSEHMKRMENGYSHLASLYAALINNDGKVTNIGDNNRKFTINGEEKRIDMHSLAGKGRAIEEAIGKEDYFTLDDIARVESTWTNKLSSSYYKNHENAPYFDRVAEKITAKKRELQNAKEESKPVIVESSYSPEKTGETALKAPDAEVNEVYTEAHTIEEIRGSPDAKPRRFSGMLGRVAAGGLFALYTLGFVGAAAIEGPKSAFADSTRAYELVLQDGKNLVSGTGSDPNDKRLYALQTVPDLEVTATRLSDDNKVMSVTELISHGAKSLEENVANAYTTLSDYISNAKSEMTFGAYARHKLNSIGRKAKGWLNAIMNYENDMHDLEISIFENGENGVTRRQLETWLQSPAHPFFNTAKEIKEKYGAGPEAIKSMITSEFNDYPIMHWLYDELGADDTGKYDAWAATDGVQKRLEEAWGRQLNNNQRLKLLLMAATITSSGNMGVAQNAK